MMDRLKKRMPAAGSLGNRALRAGGWNLTQALLGHVLRLGSNLVMTRLLMPDAFALVSFMFLIITAFNLMTDVGVRNSILQETDGGDATFLRTAWLWKMARGAVVAALVLVCALVFALTAQYWAPEGTIYADDRLPLLIAFAALVPLIEGAQSTNREFAERSITLGRVTVIDLVAQAISILAMIGFAQISATVWALMAGSLVSSVVKVIGTHTSLPGPRMGWEWDSAIAWRIWHFGKWLIGSSMLNFVAKSADKLILGALLNIVTFGLFTIAVVWITAGTRVIQLLIGRVAYPVINEIKRDRYDELGGMMARIQRLIDMLCLLGFAAAFLLGPFMVKLLYTETYHMSGQILGILSLSMLSLRFELLNRFLLSHGDSRSMMMISLQRAAFLIIFLPLSFNTFGLSAALIVVGLHPLVSVPYLLYRLRNLLDASAIRLSVIWTIGTLLISVVVAQTMVIS